MSKQTSCRHRGQRNSHAGRKNARACGQGFAFLRTGVVLLATGLPLLSQVAVAANPILDDAAGNPDPELRALVNQTQANITDVIAKTCPDRANAADYLARCDGFVGFARDRRQIDDGQDWRPGYANALQQISAEQYINQGTTATRTAGNIIGSRLAALRLGARGFNVAGLNINGRPATNAFVDQLARMVSGGAAGDDTGDRIWNRLGVFFNGIGSFGDIDTTATQVGFDFRSAGVATGMDYRFSDSLIVGAAFTYMRMESDFHRNQGSLNSDAFSGSIYSTYYMPNGFYVDAMGTVGGLEYDSSRNFNYQLTNLQNQTFDAVNATAVARPGGKQYVASVGVGFNHNIAGMNINPYLRGNYNRLDVGEAREQGGDGLGVVTSDQTVESVTSVLGAQISYAISTASAVLTPYVHGEWRHEFEDNSRTIQAQFLGNTSAPVSFGIVTENPDRNYASVGVGVSATFPRGVSAFANYDTLLGYRHIQSHAFVAGVRFEF